MGSINGGKGRTERGGARREEEAPGHIGQGRAYLTWSHASHPSKQGHPSQGMEEKPPGR